MTWEMVAMIFSVVVNLIAILGTFLRVENRITKVETILDMLTKGLIGQNVLERRGK